VRHLELLVDDEDRVTVAAVFDEEGVDFVRQEAWTNGTRKWQFSAPVPSDAIGYLLAELEDAGVEDEQLVIGSLESAQTPQSEALQSRFASGFDPLTQPEITSKARDMSQDPASFLAMIFLSAVIAAAGLLIGSPAIVVGSMVIAPIVGPVLTATVGAVVGDRQMLLDSLWLQTVGLVVAVGGAALFAAVVLVGGFSPSTLDITSLELVGVRMSPGLLSAVVGLAAGAAGAFGLTTKGPTSLIGVMIAAALIPTAATTGLGLVWGEPLVAIGSVLQLVMTMVLINVGAVAVLVAMGYRPTQSRWLFGTAPRRRKLAVAGTAIFLLVVSGAAAGATTQQVDIERTVIEEVDGLLDEPAHAELESITINMEYGGTTLGTDTEQPTVTVVLAYSGDQEPPAVAADLEERITASTGQQLGVRVEFVEYDEPLAVG